MENDATEEQQERGHEGDVDQQRLPSKAFVKVDSFGLEGGGVGKNSHHNQVDVVFLSCCFTFCIFSCPMLVEINIHRTAPLYTGIFPNGVAHKDDLSGVLSLIIYSILMITLIKYVFIVLSAKDSGEVLSAVGGIKEATGALTDNMIMWISVVILILLFQLQRFGTAKVGYIFAPVLTIWFLFIGIIGSEALFADLGHFCVRSIQISTCTLVFPTIVLAYMGQASYLREHLQDGTTAFYSSIPKLVYWPMFVVAVMAAIIASQSLISASCSIIQQSVALGPSIKWFHVASHSFELTNVVQLFTGLAVVLVFSITSTFLILVMIMIWKTHIILINIYGCTIRASEIIYLSTVLFKFVDGGFLPLAAAVVLVSVMYIWNYGHRKKYEYERDNMVPVKEFKEIASNPRIHRVPGLALFYTQVVQGISPIFSHYGSNVPALHSVLVFVSIKSLPISRVPTEERFLFRRVEPYELAVFGCIVRYGNKDDRARKESETLEVLLANQLKEFIRNDLLMLAPPRRKQDHNEVVARVDEEEVEREARIVDDALNHFGCPQSIFSSFSM
ncbi:hypothetical protein RJ640_014862 [Escallonia rubra]|uniref:Potassium transporter n=1 Tax=Escallonia rubra TaxID=112253 RepID=A0AA88RXV4_9ASTE|nr:hypothetical protein RJ640_014862 [Escallonia rubra]